MNDEEIKLYYDILDKMKKHKAKFPYLYNSNDCEFISKEEFYVTNNIFKGIILYKKNDKYLLDIYVGNGTDSIIMGLFSKLFDNFDSAKKIFDDNISYIKDNSIETILKNGERNFDL